MMINATAVTNHFSLMESDAKSMDAFNLTGKVVSNVSIQCKLMNMDFVKFQIVIEWRRIVVLCVNLDSLLLMMDLVKEKTQNV